MTISDPARSLLTAHRSPDYDVDLLRRTEFPWTDQAIYLDHASIGPLPERTRRVVERFATKRAQPFLLKHEDMFGAFARARELCANLINAEPGEIALTTNTTFGLSLAARALPFQPGDRVVTSDKEFPANVYPWMRLGDRGVTLELVPTTPEGWPDEVGLLQRIQDPRVKAIAVSLTQFANGYTIDLARLSAEARRTGTWLILDAIQGIGQLPVDVRETPVDLLSCGAQKWLLSPWGSGFVYVKKDLIAELEPAMTGWMAFEGTDDFTRLTQYNPTLRGDARRFELITLPFQDFAGMNSSLELLLSLGIDAIARHLRTLHGPVLEWAAQRGVRVASPTGSSGSGIVCVAPPRLAESYSALKQAAIYCSQREGALRLSPHCYNTVGEMERVVAVLDGVR
jgi:selenocysteine lyase/cysteine desulfurase